MILIMYVQCRETIYRVMVLCYIYVKEVRGLNLTVFRSGNQVYTNCECIKGFAFKMAGTRDRSVHYDRFRCLSRLQQEIM